MAGAKNKDSDLIRMAAKAFGRLGGLARARSLSKEQLADIGKKGAEARKAALSPQRRKEIAEKASRARAKMQKAAPGKGAADRRRKK